MLYINKLQNTVKGLSK